MLLMKLAHGFVTFFPDEWEATYRAASSQLMRVPSPRVVSCSTVLDLRDDKVKKLTRGSHKKLSESSPSAHSRIFYNHSGLLGPPGQMAVTNADLSDRLVGEKNSK